MASPKQEAIISPKATPPLKAKEAAKTLTSCALTWEVVSLENTVSHHSWC